MTDTTTVAAGVGLTDPTLALGLMGISDYSTEMPFLDLMKESRPWIGHSGGTWNAMTYQQLQAGGYLDSNGWLTKMPPGLTSVGTIWAWGNGNDPATDPAAASRAGIYVLHYDGTGTIQLQGDAKILSSQPGEIVFQNVSGNQFMVNITATDPNGTGDYIRDISVVNEKYEGLYQTGEMFNPDWLNTVSDARELRFMDWMAINSTSTATDWADRPQVNAATYMGTGVPVEVMVALANQTGADPWFNMPTGASADYIRQFATYVHDHLDPGLVAHVEYSNEAWNAALPAYQQMVAGSQAAWGVSAPFDYYAMQVTQMGQIWDQVFGADASSRIDIVMGTQTANAWIANEEMSAPIWQAHDPTGYVAPASVVDSLAVTTYFGAKTMTNATMRADLLNEIQTHSTADAIAWLAAKLQDPTYAGSIPQIEAQWAANKAVAEKYGLNLVAYEGGQHVQQSFAVSGISATDLATLTSFLTEFVRSTAMADLYTQLWSAWSQVGDGPFMQYGDVSAPSQYGSWGLLSSLGDSNPRAAALFALNDEGSSWFGSDGGSQYQQGVIQIADDTGNILTGTMKDDFLVGGAGNDVFIPGAGHDGINGGGGVNTLILSGHAADYTLVQDGAGYLLTGDGSTDYILNIQDFHFDNSETRTLDQMLHPAPPAPPVVVGGSDGGGGGSGSVTPPPTPSLPTSPGVLSLAPVGHLVDASTASQVELTDGAGKGLRIEEINVWSAIGKELGVTAQDSAPSYVISDKNGQAVIDGATVNAGYYTLQENTTTKGGAALSPDALATALQLGSVVTDAHAIVGTSAADTFLGRNGVNIFYGAGGNDYMAAGGGADQLYGGAGNDTLVSGGGNDQLFGGAGNDRFQISLNVGHDLIMDFSAGDVLDLRSLNLAAGTTLASMATTDASGNLDILHGHNEITLVGLHQSDLSWISVMV